MPKIEFRTPRPYSAPILKVGYCVARLRESLHVPTSVAALRQILNLVQQWTSRTPAIRTRAKEIIKQLAPSVKRLALHMRNQADQVAAGKELRCSTNITPPQAFYDNPNSAYKGTARQVLASQLPEAVQRIAQDLFSRTFHKDGGSFNANGRVGERYEYSSYVIVLPNKSIHEYGYVACSEKEDRVNEGNVMFTDFLDLAIQSLRDKKLTEPIRIYFLHTHPDDAEIHADGRYYTQLSHARGDGEGGDYLAHGDRLKRAAEYLKKAGYEGRIELVICAIPVPLQQLGSLDPSETYIATYSDEIVISQSNRKLPALSKAA